MHRRQSKLPRQWLIADELLGDQLWPVVSRLPRGSGILLLFHNLPRRERARLAQRLRRTAAARGLIVLDEASGGEAARVHDLRELSQALLRGTNVILLSPMFPTRSHPDWPPLPRMRAAALARLCRGRLFALGGMDAQRFRRVERLGFVGWAGIDGFRT
jgi:thiamine-phosphate pyrophosphorylase